MKTYRKCRNKTKTLHNVPKIKKHKIAGLKRETASLDSHVSMEMTKPGFVNVVPVFVAALRVTLFSCLDINIQNTCLVCLLWYCTRTCYDTQFFSMVCDDHINKCQLTGPVCRIYWHLMVKMQIAANWIPFCSAAPSRHKPTVTGDSICVHSRPQ